METVTTVSLIRVLDNKLLKEKNVQLAMIMREDLAACLNLDPRLGIHLNLGPLLDDAHKLFLHSTFFGVFRQMEMVK